MGEIKWIKICTDIFADDAIEWATPVVQKKLYKIADGIMSDLRLESEDKE